MHPQDRLLVIITITISWQ